MDARLQPFTALKYTLGISSKKGLLHPARPKKIESPCIFSSTMDYCKALCCNGIFDTLMTAHVPQEDTDVS